MKYNIRALSLITVLVLGWFPTTSSRAEQRLSVQERAAQREQALGGLDDPDKVVRMTTFEDILNSADTSLKLLATKKIITASDVDLKTLAIKYYLSRQNREHDFVISQCLDIRNTHYCDTYMPRTGGSIPMFFVNFDNEAGKFDLFSTLSNFYPSDIKNSLTEGRLDGEKLIIHVETVKASLNHCRGTLLLSSSGTFEGDLFCDGVISLKGSLDIF